MAGIRDYGHLIKEWFVAVDANKSGKISGLELQAALINERGMKFSEKTCKLMISLVDKDKDDHIDVNEFQELYHRFNMWIQVFYLHDLEQSGFVEEHQLALILQELDYTLSPDFVRFLIDKADSLNQKKLSVDQFIANMVKIEKFTKLFKSKVAIANDAITVGFEDFMEIVLNCI